MLTGGRRVRQLELCDPTMFGDMIITCQSLPMVPIQRETVARRTPPPRLRSRSEGQERKTAEADKRRASALMDQLLVDIYSNVHNCSDYNSTTSTKSQQTFRIEKFELARTNVQELKSIIGHLESHVCRVGRLLVRQLKRRDALRRQSEAHCDVISKHLRKRFPDSSEMRFSIEPGPGDSGFSQWHSAMKMVAQLPEGIPPEFRRRLWLTLADKHLLSRDVDWKKVERNCFSEWSHPADSELGVQIVKDLHRTGCSLFCGEDGQENQALLKKVLLAYARWNKAVGYCQGFNMLAALILQVTDKCESDALKLMIYLIEGVLPDSYFADSLRGLSVDMAVFRELLRSKLPRLSRHLDALQAAAKEGTTSYEPPLTNVFTMQWFLTLFCNCLPQPTVLRVWDLILLEGNEILLRTALAIWQALADRILAVRSADEFYSIMGVLTREMLEFGIVDANSLIKSVVAIGPLEQLKILREHYLYNINPWGASIAKEETDNVDKQIKLYSKEKLVLDISVLKKQYVKLKQRQRQAHIIFNAAVTRQPRRVAPVAMNHLLLGKSALVQARRLGPPKGAIPPARQPTTLQWKDAPKVDSSSSSSDTELCDDPNNSSSEEETEHQLPIDNLNKTSDNVVENSSVVVQTSSAAPEGAENPLDSNVPADNISPEPRAEICSVPLETSCGQKDSPASPMASPNESKSDIFESASGVCNKFSLDRSDSLESEEAFDFEHFLEERIRCLKETSLVDAAELDRVKYGRKNSERALQIIQENSLILHRILQCQSRTASFQDDDNTTCQSYAQTDNENLISASASIENIISPSISTFETLQDTKSSCSQQAFVTELDSPQDNALEIGTANILNVNTLIDSKTLQTNANYLPSLPVLNFEEIVGKQIEIETDILPVIKNDEIMTPSLVDYIEISENTKIENDHLSQLEIFPFATQIIAPSINYRSEHTYLEIESKHDNETQQETNLIKLQLLDKSPVTEHFPNNDLISLTTKPDIPKYAAPVLSDINAVNKSVDAINSITITENIEIEDNINGIRNDCNNMPPTEIKINKSADLSTYQEHVNSSCSDALDTSSVALINNGIIAEPNLLVFEETSINTNEVSASSLLDVDVNSIDINSYDKSAENQGDGDFQVAITEDSSSLTDVQQKMRTLQFNMRKAGNYLEEHRNKNDQRNVAAKLSKYQEILRYSQDLDDRYNNLILNVDNTSYSNQPEIECANETDFVLDASLDSDASKSNSYCLDTKIETAIMEEESFRLQINTSDLDEFKPDEAFESSLNAKYESSGLDSEKGDFEGENTIRVKSPSRITGESSSLRSPNRIYNPFPVNISSRQNKDMAVKLGLYKK